MKIEGVKYTLEEIVFCQGQPVFSERYGYVLVPNPCKRVYSDLVSTKDLRSKKVFNKWIGAVAGCGLAQTEGVPILQNHYRLLAKAATPWVPGEGDTYYKHSWWNAANVPEGKRRFAEPSARERVSFFLAFNITPGVQRVVEKWLDNQPPPTWTKPISTKTTIPIEFKVGCPPIQQDRILDFGKGM